MSTPPMKPIRFKLLGERRVIVEVPPPPKVVRRIVKRHEHAVRWGVFERVIHRHELDLDNPEHIHEHFHDPEEPDGAA